MSFVCSKFYGIIENSWDFLCVFFSCHCWLNRLFSCSVCVCVDLKLFIDLKCLFGTIQCLYEHWTLSIRKCGTKNCANTENDVVLTHRFVQSEFHVPCFLHVYLIVPFVRLHWNSNGWKKSDFAIWYQRNVLFERMLIAKIKFEKRWSDRVLIHIYSKHSKRNEWAGIGENAKLLNKSNFGLSKKSERCVPNVNCIDLTVDGRRSSTSVHLSMLFDEIVQYAMCPTILITLKREPKNRGVSGKLLGNDRFAVLFCRQLIWKESS